MILGIGNDLVDIVRIEKDCARHGDRFIQRCFTEAEIVLAHSRPENLRAATYAKRFAAKEACAKALGTGFRDGIALQDIGVGNDEKGRPFLQLTGGAAVQLEHITPEGKTAVLYLSMADEPLWAQAFVVIEAD